MIIIYTYLCVCVHAVKDWSVIVCLLHLDAVIIKEFR